MGAKSKLRGNQAERELCKLLSGILSGSFVRVPNSGAAVGGKHVSRRQTLSRTQDRVFRGDIIPPDHLPHLVVESKSYASFAFHALLQPGPCPLLDEWIAQTLDVVDVADVWFVAFKIRFLGWYMVIPETPCADYQFGNYCAYTGVHGSFRVTDLRTFLLTNREMVLRLAGSDLTKSQLMVEPQDYGISDPDHLAA